MIVNRAWVWAKPSRWLAFGFGSGLAPKAPGTVGTLYAWALFLIFQELVDESTLITLVALAMLLGVWLCGKVGEEIGVPDHSGIVWDEFVAYWLILLIISPAGIGLQVMAFLLFRFFDAVKPEPIRSIDRFFKTWQPSVEEVGKSKPVPAWLVRGFGVMIDDIAAAIATLMVIAIGVRL